MIKAYSNIVAPSCLTKSPVAFADPPTVNLTSRGVTSRYQIIHYNDAIRGSQHMCLNLKDICAVFFDVFSLHRRPWKLSTFSNWDEADV